MATLVADETTNNNNTNNKKVTTATTADADNNNDKVRLNVGGTYFLTTYTTLSNVHNNSTPTYFHGIISEHFKKEYDKQLSEEYYFIDRDPTYFRYVLNYLRDGNISGIPKDNVQILNEILQEASFYSINGLTIYITKILNDIYENKKKSNSDVKEHKLFQDLNRYELQQTFNEYVKKDGYDVVSMTQGDSSHSNGRQLYNLILCKHISMEDMSFVNRLMKTS